MNRHLLGLALAAMMLVPLSAHAAGKAGEAGHTDHMDMAMHGKTATITGELVDMGCYLDHGARGAKHAECATRCISDGMPMGVLTASNELYLVTMDHDDADPYNALKKMAAKTVSVTGPVFMRNGMKAIDAQQAKVAAAK